MKLPIIGKAVTNGVAIFRPNMLASGLQSSIVDLLVSNADVLFPDGTQSSLLIVQMVLSHHC